MVQNKPCFIIEQSYNVIKSQVTILTIAKIIKDIFLKRFNFSSMTQNIHT